MANLTGGFDLRRYLVIVVIILVLAMSVCSVEQFNFTVSNPFDSSYAIECNGGASSGGGC